jgi:hypothetical protein
MLPLSARSASSKGTLKRRRLGKGVLPSKRRWRSPGRANKKRLPNGGLPSKRRWRRDGRRNKKRLQRRRIKGLRGTRNFGRGALRKRTNRGRGVLRRETNRGRCSNNRGGTRRSDRIKTGILHVRDVTKSGSSSKKTPKLVEKRRSRRGRPTLQKGSRIERQNNKKTQIIWPPRHNEMMPSERRRHANEKLICRRNKTIGPERPIGPKRSVLRKHEMPSKGLKY